MKVIEDKWEYISGGIMMVIGNEYRGTFAN
jgi:hypothetical protein